MSHKKGIMFTWLLNMELGIKHGIGGIQANIPPANNLLSIQRGSRARQPAKGVCSAGA